MTSGSSTAASFDDTSLDAAPLDTADPLAPLRDRFVQGGDVVAYLDGN